MATENAIGAWARIALTHRQDLIGDFLNYLPLKNDEEEARNIHKLVVENYQVLQGNPNFVKLVVELKAQSPKIVDEPTRQFLASF